MSRINQETKILEWSEKA